jgi:peptide/nickel transport system permease protein
MPVDPVTALVGDQADRQTYAVYERLGSTSRCRCGSYYLRDVATGNFGRDRHRPPGDRGHPARFPRPGLATLSRSSAACSSACPRRRRGVSRARGRPPRALFGPSLVPHFWLGLIALVIFYAWLGWIGGSGASRSATSTPCRT